MSATRLFFGIPPSSALRDAFAAHVGPVAARNGEWRWTSTSDLHVTVAFFGAVEDADRALLTAALRSVAGGTAPFDLTLVDVEQAPSETGGLAWARFADNAVFTRFADAAYDAAEPFIGPRSDRKPPLPHMTLARCGNGDCAPVDDLSPLRDMPWTVAARECVLYAADASVREGPRYHALERLPLGTQAS